MFGGAAASGFVPIFVLILWATMIIRTYGSVRLSYQLGCFSLQIVATGGV